MNEPLNIKTYEPTKPIKAVIQIVHGAGEHAARYQNFIDYLVDEGFVVLIHTHTGHGERMHYEDRIHFDNYQTLKNDVLKVKETINSRWPNEKHIVIAHSMGSFIVRSLMREHKDMYDHYFLLGTAKLSKLSLRIGKAINWGLLKIKDHTHVSPFLNGLTDSGVKKMQKSGIINKRYEWLTSDAAMQKAYLNDPYTQKPFTIKARYELFKLLLEAESYKHMKSNASSHPIHLLCGEHDGLCDFGSSLKNLYNCLFQNGYTNVHFTVYPNARHELLNENTRIKIYNDIIKHVNHYTLA